MGKLFVGVPSAFALPLAALADDIPDLAKTPGVARPGLTVSKICTIKWGQDARDVTAAMKAEAFQRYGFAGFAQP